MKTVILLLLVLYFCSHILTAAKCRRDRVRLLHGLSVQTHLIIFIMTRCPVAVTSRRVTDARATFL